MAENESSIIGWPIRQRKIVRIETVGKNVKFSGIAGLRFQKLTLNAGRNADNRIRLFQH